MICPSCLKEKGPSLKCPLPTCGFDEAVGPAETCLPFRHTLQGEKYVVGNILGSRGGFGVAYKAKAPGSFVVIKEFQGGSPDHVSRQPGSGMIVVDDDYEPDYQRALRHFRREAKFLEEIAHPNIVRVLEVFDENNTSYYVMPFVDGSDLGQHLAKHGVMAPDLVLSIARDLLAALARLHARGTEMLHCDIKPSNVLLTDRKKKAILLDFGAARRKPPKDATQPVLYSPTYAPPELIERDIEALGEWSDMYLLSATLYECLSGKRPPKISESGTRAASYVPIQQWVPSVHPALASFIDRGLALSPEDRPNHAQEELNALPTPPKPPGPERKSLDTVSKLPARWKWLGALEATLALYGMYSPQSWDALIGLMVAALVSWFAVPGILARMKRKKAVELALIGKNEQRMVVKKLLPSQAATIGRSKDADISIDNKRLSSLHASVVMNEDGTYTLKDLKSLNHTYYRHDVTAPPEKWKRISSVTLTNGSRFMLGNPIEGGVLLEVMLLEVAA